MEEIQRLLIDNKQACLQMEKRLNELESEKSIARRQVTDIPNYDIELNAIVQELRLLKNEVNATKLLDMLNTLSERLENVPQSVNRQTRFLLFPENNQAQYYKIVFGRLLPWGLIFTIVTYIFIAGKEAMEIYRHKQDIAESQHYKRAWIYLQTHSKKKKIVDMQEIFDKTGDR